MGLKTKKILIVSNYENTYRWLDFYQAFQKAGFIIEILVFSKRDLQHARNLGYKIIDLRLVSADSACNVSKYSIDENYFYNRQGFLPSEKQVKSFVNRIMKVLTENKYFYLFGEKTWPYELLIKNIANDLNIQYLSPISIRIPYQYHFLSANLEKPILIEGSLSSIEIDKIIDCQKNGELPEYFFENNNLKNIKRLKAFISNLNYYKSEALTIQTFNWKLKNLFNKISNRYLIKKFLPDTFSDFCYFVHVQPESSIDFLGNGLRNNDQILDWVSYIRGVENQEIKLSIKFHSNYYGQFLNIQKKHLWVKKNINNSKDILRNRIIPITSSGTVALESIWTGLPAIVTGKPYFSNFTGIYCVESKEQLKDCLGELKSKSNVDLFCLEKDVRNFLKYCFDRRNADSLQNYVNKL